MELGIKFAIICLAALIVEAVPAPLLNCQHDEYIDGTVENPICSKCPLCQPGFGLNAFCNNKVQFPKEKFVCHPCGNETFSAFKSAGMCDLCREPCSINEVETQQCSATSNRLCACKPGMFEHAAHGQCNQECCHCAPWLGIVKKCEEDNIDGRFCGPPGPSGKCHPISTTRKVHTSVVTDMSDDSSKETTMEALSKKSDGEVEVTVVKLTTGMSKVVSIDDFSTQTTITDELETELNIEYYWIYACVVVVLFSLIFGYLLYCNTQRRRRRRQESHCADDDFIWMDDVTNDQSSVIYAGVKNSQRKPLVYKPNVPPAVPTSARPTIPLFEINT